MLRGDDYALIDLDEFDPQPVRDRVEDHITRNAVDVFDLVTTNVGAED